MSLHAARRLAAVLFAVDPELPVVCDIFVRSIDRGFVELELLECGGNVIEAARIRLEGKIPTNLMRARSDFSRSVPVFPDAIADANAVFVFV